ncbi:MAG: transcription termination/antitermination protein NusG [Candidatus Aminicenantia bacterium]
MKNWFVVHTKPQKEFTVETLLKQAGISVYNPKYKQSPSGLRTKERIKSLFPGYEFVYFDFPNHYKMIKYTRGVKKIIENENGPIPVHPEIINEIKAREVNGFIEFRISREEPKIGDEVEIMDGPFKGFQGIFKKETKDSERVMILLRTINYQAQMVIERKKLTKVIS